MPSNLHIINKQAFEFECVQSGHAFQIEKKFDYNVQFKISKILERACDRISVDDTDIRIPLLEIDLGEISFDRLGEEMVLAFEKSIYGKLSELTISRNNSNILLKEKTRSSVEILIYFLLTGRLPWFAGRQDETYLARLFEEVFSTQSVTFRKFILLNLNNETFLKRLAAQPGQQEIDGIARMLDQEILGTQNELLRKFIILNLNSERYIERLVNQPGEIEIDRIIGLLGIEEALLVAMERLLRNIAGNIASLFKDAGGNNSFMKGTGSAEEDNVGKPGEPVQLLAGFMENDEGSFTLYIRKIALEFILKLVSGNKNIYTPEQFVEQFEKLLLQKFEYGSAAFYAALLRVQPQFATLPAAISRISNNLAEDLEILAAEYRKTVDIADTMEFYDLINEANIKSRDDRLILGKEEEQDDISDVLKFYISNAGMVLIAHYLPAFFKELGLLEDNRFISSDHKVRAVFLLYYLCTGREEVPEYILPLNKILCGLPLEEALPSSLKLSEKEKSESEVLLEEVINNWQRLGNSSVEGLRESFLNREGVLTLENHGWKLQVEKLGYDVLLDGLPWSFKHIKLSWMENLITTEW